MGRSHGQGQSPVSRPICCPWPGTWAPASGRFISADPFEGRQRDPRSLNRYTYAHGDPVHNIDPSGLFTTMDTGAAGSVSISTASSNIA
ncbi:MAG: hypothetical protein JNK28_09410 [Burkholderiaceae bacterium]|nr:hypothetical protein [Burkholderiaceae bacterium]